MRFWNGMFTKDVLTDNDPILTGDLESGEPKRTTLGAIKAFLSLHFSGLFLSKVEGNTLQQNITNESTARNAAINTAVNNLKNDLLGGASSAYDTFKELQTLLENDAQLTSTLVTGLANEITNRQNAITNEETARSSADETLAAQIANEATARQQAISTAVNNLKNDLLGGASSAYDTFKELQTLLENDAQLTSTLVTGLANEITNRQNAINGLQNQIENLGGGIDAETLLKINQAYNFAQQSCLTDDNGEIFTEDNGDVIIDL